MKNILVPIDFSDVTEKILDKAVEIAKALEANVLIIHVVAPVTEAIKKQIEFQAMPTLGELGGGYTPAIRYDVVRDQIAHELKVEHSKVLKVKNELADKGIKVKGLLVEGEVVSAILKEADEINADYIIIGSHGHGPWHKALLGSVTDAVIKNVKCPLIVIPSKTA